MALPALTTPSHSLFYYFEVNPRYIILSITFQYIAPKMDTFKTVLQYHYHIWKITHNSLFVSNIHSVFKLPVVPKKSSFHSWFEPDLSKGHSFSLLLLPLPSFFPLVIFIEEIFACGAPHLCLAGFSPMVVYGMFLYPMFFQQIGIWIQRPQDYLKVCF